MVVWEMKEAMAPTLSSRPPSLNALSRRGEPGGRGVDRGDVRRRVVVAEHGRLPAGALGQVLAVRAQVAARGVGSVVEVLRVGDPVAVLVGAPLAPGGGEEL